MQVRPALRFLKRCVALAALGAFGSEVYSGACLTKVTYSANIYMTGLSRKRCPVSVGD